MTSSRSPSFATTRWSIVRAAATADVAERQAALTTLFETYWKPVYAYCRRQGLSLVDAEDASQEFYARLLDGRDLAAADPERGRFRAYLLTCLKHFLSNLRRDASAQKRGGDKRLLSIDTEAAESWQQNLSDDLEPERLFERAWALTLLDRAMATLRVDYESSGRGQVFTTLKPALTGDHARPYAELATDLETSEGAVKVAVHKLRQRFGEVLRKEIADTVTSPEAVEAEIRDLFAALG